MQKQKNWFKKYNKHLWNISGFIFALGIMFIITVVIANILVNELPAPPYPSLPCDSFCCSGYCGLPINWFGLASMVILAVVVITIVYWAFKPNASLLPTLKRRVSEKVK